MEKYLGRFEPQIYAVLRFVIGFSIIWHGTQKLFGFPSTGKPPMPLGAMMGVAGTIELFGGLMIMFGLFAGFAAFIASGMMAVAYFTQHAPGGFLPIEEGGNKGERAVIYCFIFLYIAARGSGIWSLDWLFGRSKRAAVVES